MKKEVAVISADWHLTERSWAHRDVHGDSYYSLAQIVTYCVKHNLPLVGCGDLLDRQANRAKTIVMFNREMERLREAGVAVWLGQGQHEFEGDTPWLAVNPWPQHYHRVQFDLGPFTCYGTDYVPAGQFQQEMAEIPAGTHIWFGHQVLGDHMGDIAAPQGSMCDVPKVSQAFVGDYHKRCSTKTRGQDGQELILHSPGATCMNAINEPSDCYFLVLHDDGSVHQQRLETRRFIAMPVIAHPDDADIVIANLAMLCYRAEEASAALPEELRKPLLQVTYGAQFTDIEARVRKLVGDRVHLFLKEIPIERPADPVRRAASMMTGKAATLESELEPYLQEKELLGLKDDCQRLLQAADPADELARMRAEALTETPEPAGEPA